MSFLKPNKTEILKKPINFAAGSKLLVKNEQTWCEIHKFDEQNALKVEKINKKCEFLHKNTKNISNVIKDFKLHSKNVLTMETNLKNCVKLINEINELCNVIDEKLEKFEDTIEEIKYQDQLAQHKIDICQFQQKKLKEMEFIRENLRVEHEKKLLDYENQLKKRQLERQLVFQTAFQNDLALYEETGKIPKIEHGEDTGCELSLEEITLDCSDGDLEKFLNED